MKTVRYSYALVVVGTLAAHHMTVAAFAFSKSTTTTTTTTTPSLSDDYAAAQQRKALQEEILLQRPGGDVELPYFDDEDGNDANESTKKKKKKRRSRNSRSVGGGGFGVKNNKKSSSSSSSLQQQQPKTASQAQKVVASAMATAIRRDGVIRLPSLLSETSCATIRSHVLQLQSDVAALAARSSGCQSADESSPSSTTTEDKVRLFDATDYYGVEPGRTCRTDLLLPLDAEVQGTLSELLDVSNPLRHLLCELFPLTAPLYEVAAVITTPGSHRQTIHPDLPHKPECPLYVVFVALQDVTPDMGPTTFLRGTQHAPLPYSLDETLVQADVVISTLKKGDAVIFDARILHCGNANTASSTSTSSSSSSTTTRALFNFSFRQPDSGALGYEGSIRKGYIGKTTLGELLQVADQLNGWGGDSSSSDDDDGGGGTKKTLESVYGNGLL